MVRQPTSKENIIAVAVPIIAAWAGAATAVTAAVAGAATLTGFLTIAGASLVTIGALRKDSDLMKIGGFMTLAGGLGSAYQASTAAAAENAAAQEAANSSWAAGGQAEVAAQAAGSADEAAYASWGSAGQAEVAAAQAAEPSIASTITGSFEYQPPAQSLLDTAAQRASTQTVAQAATPPDIATPSQLTGPVDPLSKGAERMTSQQVSSLLKTQQDKAAEKAAADRYGAHSTAMGRFVQDNKELMNIGGGLIKGMYGPEAESLNMRQSIYERQRANMNSPVRLGIVKAP